MDTTIVNIKQHDGYETRLFCYKTLNNPVYGNILILHGMAEHHKRYLDFIRVLLQEGFDVYTYDHRGHGTDKKLSDLGHIADRNGATLLVEDSNTVYQYVKQYGRSEKTAVFGHSMGSLILRGLIQTNDKMDCAIVSSTTMPPISISQTGMFISNLICLFGNARKHSPFLQKLLFGSKEYTSLCTRTSYDWLTRNNTIVGKYIDDPYCGFLCTSAFYRDLVTLTVRATKKNNIAKTRRELPLLFLAGTRDPVGGYASQVQRLHSRFTALGFQNTELKLYPEARHELLNELNADEIYQDIISYLHCHLH